MQCISAKFVFCILTIEQKERSLSLIANFLQETEMDQNFMEGIITGDEKQVYGYDPETNETSVFSLEVT